MKTNNNFTSMKMARTALLLFLFAAAMMVFISCNGNKSSNKTVVNDSATSKYNPAAEQKNGSTYNPKETGSDTMYKNVDSVPK